VLGPTGAVPPALGTVVLVPALEWACGGWARWMSSQIAATTVMSQTAIKVVEKNDTALNTQHTANVAQR